MDNTSDIGKKIQDRIYQRLQIKDVTQAIASADRLARRIQRNIKVDNKNTQLQALEQQRQANQEQIAQSQQILSQNEVEIEQAQKELEVKKQNLQSSAGTRGLVQQIENLTNQQQQVQQTLKQNLINLTSLVKMGTSQLFKDLLPEMKTQVQNLR
ncbi:hypothetical protein EQ500_13275, partial [Lactobacillus sp. XV13L]|nr:hypothetical protein [Lactobacillus sp. XV13L]